MYADSLLVMRLCGLDLGVKRPQLADVSTVGKVCPPFVCRYVKADTPVHPKRAWSVPTGQTGARSASCSDNATQLSAFHPVETLSLAI